MKERKKDGRKLRSESTADLILNTVLKIVRKGDIDISFNAIAKEAKIGTRTIFRHFKDKKLFKKILIKYLRMNLQMLFYQLTEKIILKRELKSFTVLIQLYIKNQNILRWTFRTFGATKL